MKQIQLWIEDRKAKSRSEKIEALAGIFAVVIEHSAADLPACVYLFLDKKCNGENLQFSKSEITRGLHKFAGVTRVTAEGWLENDEDYGKFFRRAASGKINFVNRRKLTFAAVGNELVEIAATKRSPRNSNGATTAIPRKVNKTGRKKSQITGIDRMIGGIRSYERVSGQNVSGRSGMV